MADGIRLIYLVVLFYIYVIITYHDDDGTEMFPSSQCESSKPIDHGHTESPSLFLIPSHCSNSSALFSEECVNLSLKPKWG